MIIVLNLELDSQVITSYPGRYFERKLTRAGISRCRPDTSGVDQLRSNEQLRLTRSESIVASKTGRQDREKIPGYGWPRWNTRIGNGCNLGGAGAESECLAFGVPGRKNSGSIGQHGGTDRVRPVGAAFQNDLQRCPWIAARAQEVDPLAGSEQNRGSASVHQNLRILQVQSVSGKVGCRIIAGKKEPAD